MCIDLTHLLKEKISDRLTKQNAILYCIQEDHLRKCFTEAKSQRMEKE